MLKNLYTSAIFLLLASCSSLKQMAFTNNSKQASPAVAPEQKEVKFLDNISSTPSPSVTDDAVASKAVKKENQTETLATPVKNDVHTGTQSLKPKAETIKYEETAVPAVEKASSLQLKYSLLLNTDVEEVQNLRLYQSIDEWYGTPYKYGGTTKRGIDCSAFVQSVFISAFAVTLPRTASEQYKYVKLISTTQLKEGDLLFFNTTGGVSHVGIYLRNNKFVHASVANGVTVTDMFEPYYVKHLIAVGRLENGEAVFHPGNVYKSPYHKKKKHYSKKKTSKKTSKKK